ncbi:MAG: alpha/beta fold hydrolase [bacterium]|nr:alpha/beta fold hydrolase [bacterium]
MAVVNSGGVDIFYEIMNAEGPGLPIFFIAGLNGMRSACMKQAVPFSKERPVVLHDHRGTGKSAQPLGVYSVENMAADVVAIMDDAGIKEAHLVGTSTGGATIQVLCIDHPERVRSAAICCSWPKSDHFFIRQFEMRKLFLLSLGTEALTRLTSTTLNDPKYFTDHYDEILEKEKQLIADASSPEVAAERIDSIIAHDQLDRLGQIRVPVIVIGAKNDAVCPPYYSEQLAEAIPGAELKLYEDGGHFFYMVYADKFNSDIREFIAKHE